MRNILFFWMASACMEQERPVVGQRQRENVGVVEAVVDADTIRLEDGREIDLIGVREPLLTGRCVQEARRALEDLVNGKRVRLKRDSALSDDSQARYVFAEDDEQKEFFVNERLIKSGFSDASPTHHLLDVDLAIKLPTAKEFALKHGLGCQWQGCFKITDVIDGDTIEYKSDGEDRKVRLIGVSAPEKNQYCGDESKIALEQFENQYVRLSHDSLNENQDAFGRRLGYLESCTSPYEDIGTIMIRQGFACAYQYEGNSFDKQGEYAKAQANAKKDHEEQGTGCWVGQPQFCGSLEEGTGSQTPDPDESLFSCDGPHDFLNSPETDPNPDPFCLCIADINPDSAQDGGESITVGNVCDTAVTLDNDSWAITEAGGKVSEIGQELEVEACAAVKDCMVKGGLAVEHVHSSCLGEEIAVVEGLKLYSADIWGAANVLNNGGDTIVIQRIDSETEDTVGQMSCSY